MKIELLENAQTELDQAFSFPRAAWECGQGALRRESRATRLRIRNAARPALHSHAARGNEAYLNICV